MSKDFKGGGKVLTTVIFDLDGVLVTTDHFHYLGWKMLADNLNMKFSEHDNHLLRGVSRLESLKTIYRLNNRELSQQSALDEQMAKKNNFYVELINKMSPADVLPGALELLQELKDAGIKSAIASSSKNAGLVLARTGLDTFMDAVCDGNIITHSKPHPEVFMRAAVMTGSMPWNCVGVEDAAAGIESIKSAGMVALGVGDQATRGDRCVGSVADISLRFLRELFAGANCGPDADVRKMWESYAAGR